MSLKQNVYWEDQERDGPFIVASELVVKLCKAYVLRRILIYTSNILGLDSRKLCSGLFLYLFV